MTLTFTKVLSSTAGHLTMLGSDGNTYTVTGDRNNRNNNPGNIAAGSGIAQQFGAVGSDGSVGGPGKTPMAVFPTVAAGQAAQQASVLGHYGSSTILGMAQRYAPAGAPDYNDPAAYAATLAKAAGVPVTAVISSLTPAQQSAMLAAQANLEGSKPQAITDAQGNNVVFPPADVPNGAGSYAGTASSNTASAYTGIGGSPALSAITDALAPTAGQQQGVPLARQQPFSIPGFNPFTAGDALAFDPATVNGGALPGQMDAGYNATTGQMQPYDTANTRAAMTSSTPATVADRAAQIRSLLAMNTSGSPDDRNSAASTFTGNTQAGVEQLPAGWHPAPGVVPSLDSVPTPVSQGTAPYGGPFNSMDAAAGNASAPYGGQFNSIDATAGNNASWDALVKSFTSQIGGSSNASTGGADYSAAGTINNSKDQSQLPAGSPLAFDPNATGAPDYTTLPGSGTPTIMSQQLNPAYTAWMNNQQPSGGINVSGSATGAVGINGLASGAATMSPAPPKYVRTPMANPNYVAPRRIAVGPATPAYSAAPTAPVASAPMTLVQQLQASGLSPANAYNVAAGLPVTSINSGNFASAGNNNASARAQMTPGGSLSSGGR